MPDARWSRRRIVRDVVGTDDHGAHRRCPADRQLPQVLLRGGVRLQTLRDRSGRMMSSGQPARAGAGVCAALRALLCGAALGAFTLVAPAAAQPAEPDSEPIAEAAPPPSLPSREELNRAPAATGLLLFDLLEQASAAEKSGDARGAVHAYEAIARAVPERATAFSKLCELQRALGERDAAIAACHRATGLPGSKLADHLRYIEL